MYIIDRFVNAFIEVLTPTRGAIVNTYNMVYKPVQGAGLTVVEDAKRIVRAQLEQDEGVRFVIYEDPVHKDGMTHATGGIGHLLTAGEKTGKKLGDPISRAQVTAWFDADVDKFMVKAVASAQDLGMYDPNFIAALCNVYFQSGYDFTATGEFKASYNRLKAKQFSALYSALRSSLWFRQTPKRVENFIAAVDTWRVLNRFNLDGTKQTGST